MRIDAVWEESYRAFLREPGRWDWLAPWARSAGCLPIYCDWTHVFGLDAEGSWLEPLFPARPGDARDCSPCRGTGALPIASLICYCGGAGWIPADDPTAEK
jgi:hypothetical protein